MSYIQKIKFINKSKRQKIRTSTRAHQTSNPQLFGNGLSDFLSIFSTIFIVYDKKN